MESYRNLEEVRRYSNKELKVSRELIEAVRGQKDFATLGKLKSFQYVSGIPGMAYNPFVNEEAREAYIDYEKVIVLNFWVERIKETGMLIVEQPKLGIILEERVVEPSVPELKGQVSFDCGSWDGPSSNWLKQGTCLAQHSGVEGHVCNLGHCLIMLSEQHRQLARL